jgi:hypothetical protein
MRLQIEALATPASHYTTAVYDPACADKKFALATTPEVEQAKSYKELRAILWGAYPEKKNQARVRMTAKFSWHQNEVPARVLSLSSLESAEAMNN